MEERHSKFACLEDSSEGLLDSEDVRLFYYGVGVDSELEQFVYCWDENVETYVKENKIVIDDCVAASIPSTFSENVILFTMGDKFHGNKAAALFHHLRDAFAHYHIRLSGEYYCMKDLRDEGKTITMIGKIHRKKFEGLLEEFFKQKAKAYEGTDKYYYPEI